VTRPEADPHLSRIRPEAAKAPPSGIVDVMSYGREKEGLIPLWVGEGDLPTPGFICEAAARALRDGETFYTWQRGLPPLREALARYHERLYGRPFDPARFHVTIGGMHAAQIAIRMACGVGDEVLIPTPAWPNFHGAITVSGATTVPVPMSFGPGGWSLETDRIEAAISPRTRAIVINSPANPTGWTADHADLTRILDLARRHGLWIIADEIYGRFVYDDALRQAGGRTPSFHDIMAPEDRILFVQTFSKNWAMTGWRIGWLEAPPALGQTIENLIQYSSSGVPAFQQRAALAALEEGEPFVAEQIARAARGRDIVCNGLAATGIVDLPPPAGAFYAFFRVRGIRDTRELALRLVDEANVGLAPGTAFGLGAEQHLRLCFARRAEDLEEAVARMQPVLARIATETRASAA
jgi:aspartate/methionine/tyrosine aminotransferase